MNRKGTRRNIFDVGKEGTNAKDLDGSNAGRGSGEDSKAATRVAITVTTQNRRDKHKRDSRLAEG